MAMIICPECEKSVSSQADMCPNCGFGIKRWFEINFEICPVCNTIIKKEKDKKAFCPKCRRNLSDLRLEFYGKMAHEAVIKVSAKEREEAISTGRLKEFPWQNKIVSIYTKKLDDYRLYNRINIFVKKIQIIQDWLKKELDTNIEQFENRYEDKNNGPKTIYDCCDMLINFFADTSMKLCDGITNKLNEAIPNKDFIQASDVANCYECYGDKLQIGEFLQSLSSVDHQIKQELEINKNYRNIKKASRGSFIGGGYGIKGALKGMITAGVANAAYGGLYEFKNSIANERDKNSASVRITKTLHTTDFKNTLHDVLVNDFSYYIRVVADFMVYISNEYFGVDIEEIKYLDEEYESLDKKIESRLKENDIEAFKQCLQDYPFYLPVYERILRQFGDEDNELEAIGKFCGVNIQLIKRNLLTDKTIPNKKGFTNFEYKLYLGLQETTNQFTKIKEIVSKIDGKNPKSILSAIEKLKVLDSQEAKTAIKDYIEKIVTWSNWKEPEDILSVIEELKALNNPEAEDTIKKCMDRIVTWADEKSPADILSVIEELKALNNPEAEDTIKKCMDRIVTWINGRSPEDILSVIEELKALNSPEAEDTIKKCMDRIVTWSNWKEPEDILSVIEELKALNNPEAEDTIKKCMDRIVTWADEKSPADILSTIEDLKIIDSPEAEDIIKEYKRKSEEKLKIKEVVSKSKIDGKSPKNLVLAIEQLKAVNTKDEIEKYEMIQRCEDLIITWIDGKSLERILSAIEDLASLDIPKVRDIIKEYMDKVIAWADGRSLEEVLSVIEQLKALNSPEAKDVIKEYEKKDIIKEALKIKDIVNKIDENNLKSIVLAIEELKTIDSPETKDIIKEYMDKVIAWSDGKNPKNILSAIKELKNINSPEVKDVIKEYMDMAMEWINGKSLNDILSAIEELKAINSPEAKDIIKQYMDIVMAWANGRNPKDILLAIEELKTINSPEAKDIIKQYMDIVMAWANGRNPKDILLAIEELKTINSPKAKDVIKDYMTMAIAWSEAKGLKDILSAIEELKTINSPEAKDIIKEYKKKDIVKKRNFIVFLRLGSVPLLLVFGIILLSTLYNGNTEPKSKQTLKPTEDNMKEKNTSYKEFNYTKKDVKKAGKNYLNNYVKDNVLGATKALIIDDKVQYSYYDDTWEVFIYSGKVKCQNESGVYVQSNFKLNVYFPRKGEVDWHYYEAKVLKMKGAI